MLSYSGRSRKNGHNALENDNGKATNKKNNNNINDDDDDENDGDDDTSNNNKQANMLDNWKYEENQLDVRLLSWRRTLNMDGPSHEPNLGRLFNFFDEMCVQNISPEIKY